MDESEAARSALETEYVAMRAEILERIKLRQQILYFSLVLVGAFLGAGIVREPMITLCHAPLAAFLALAWAQNDYRVRDLARYIRQHICPKVPEFAWESYMQRHRSDATLSSWRHIVLSHGGFFVLTMMLSTGVGALGLWKEIGDLNDAEIYAVGILGAIDLVAIGLTLLLVRHMNTSRRPRKTAPEPTTSEQNDDNL